MIIRLRQNHKANFKISELNIYNIEIIMPIHKNLSIIKIQSLITYIQKNMIIKIYNKQEQQPAIYSFLEKEVVIGRNPTSELSVQIKSETISRNHIKLIRKQEQIYICDLGSSNGTFIDKEQLKPKQQYLLNTNDKIKMAEFSGYLQVEIRDQCQNTINKYENSNNHKKINNYHKQQFSLRDHDRSRSKEKYSNSDDKAYKLSGSTLKMLKEMTIQHKSKEQKIKFLKLMGYAQANKYWQKIQKQLKNKTSSKTLSKHTNNELEKQFSQSRIISQKKGLGFI